MSALDLLSSRISARLAIRLAPLLAAAALLLALQAPAAQAACPPAPDPLAPFGIAPGCFDGETRADAAGATFTQAAGHPYEIVTHFDFNSRIAKDSLGEATIPSPWPVEPLRDVIFDAPPGLVGNPTVLAACTAEELMAPEKPVGEGCPPESRVGTITLRFPNFGEIRSVPLGFYRLTAPTGSPARFGFRLGSTAIVLDARLRSGGDYGLSLDSRSIPEGLGTLGFSLALWGVPADPAHDEERGGPVALAPRPFLTMPTSCTPSGQGLTSTAHADSWWSQGDFHPDGSPDLSDPDWRSASFQTHLPPGYPADPGSWGDFQGPERCDVVPFKPQLALQPTSHSVQTATGLSVSVEVPNPGLANPEGIAAAHLKSATVTLPEGVTINPSQAEGLGVCSPSRLAAETLRSAFGEGCPASSKIGTLSIESQLVDEPIAGTLYLATPDDPTAPGAENPFDSLLALYMVAKDPEQGLLIKLAGRVQTNPITGQITTSFDDLPQLPFSRFTLRFREGVRSPLVTPPACGTYTTTADFVPWSAADPDNPTPAEVRHTTSTFQITSGIGGGPCPTGGIPPFKPGLIAGSRNNNAGSYSPFDLRLFRTDSEQQFTNFSIKLPPGITGKLAGIPFCPDASIAAAKGRTGAAELASPSCPEASYVGRTLVGAGVGSVQTYVPGRIYLAGPYNGSALSIAAITAAKVGPFDLGTVVLRLALRVDPETAEVFVDPTGSDPIPHIIKGIPTKLRDIRAYVERPDFVLNPTSCDPTSTASTVLGSGLDFASPHDDQPVTVSTRFQAANCASLPFKPALALNLKGGTKRGGHPKLKAVLRMRPGMANIARAQVTLPKSAFLDQSHIGAVCTRVQYAADQCPAKSVYGYARAFTPLLDEPIEGPVYLRSSSHKLPDLVAGLKSGRIELDVVGRIDSLKGRIRSTFESVPDAPVSKFVLTMQGGKKGLLENSADLCAKAHRAIAAFDGHNGKVWDFRPLMRPDCGGKRKGKRR